MKINKEELKQALEIVKPGLAGKDLIEQTTSFAFLKGRVITYNDQISISYPLPDLELEGAIKAEELYSLLGKLKKDEIEVETTKKELILKAGRVKAGITLQTKISLPIEEIGQIGDWKKLPGNFVKALRFVSPACGSDMSKPIITCIHMTKKYAQASDGYRLARFNFNKKLPIAEALIPNPIVNELVKFEPTHMAEGDGWLHFKAENEAVFSCRVFEDTFPKVSHLLEIEGTKLKLPKSMSEILERISVFSKRDVFIDENVAIEIEENRIKMKGTSDSGWITEKANIKYSGGKLTFNVNPSLLKNILSKTNVCILSNKKIKFEEEDWQFIAMLKSVNKKG